MNKIFIFLIALCLIGFCISEVTIRVKILNRCQMTKDECNCVADVLMSELKNREILNYITAIDNNKQREYILRGLFTGDEETKKIVKAFTICHKIEN